MRPDKHNTTFSLLVRQGETKTPPKVIFSTTSLRWIKAMVEVHQLEIGWYAIVDERPDYAFFVRDVFYPKHSEANGATCEISPEGETEVMTWLMDHGRDADIPKMRLWGHSHHNMGTGPSGQDEVQALERMNSTKSFLIRIICNKEGEISCSFFDYERNLRFDHIKWEVEDDDDESHYNSQIDEIASIIADTLISSKQKVHEINSLTGVDGQYEIIRRKVEELKKVNMPSPTNYNKGKGKGKGRRSRSGYQPNLFNNTDASDPLYPNVFPDDEDDLDEQFTSAVDRDNNFDYDDIGGMIKTYGSKSDENFEEGMGVTK